MPSLLGKKLGMTQFLRTDGTMTSATVIEAGPCLVTDLRLKDKHGYKAAQIGFGDVKEKHVSKAYRSQLSKRNLPLKKWLREVRLGPNETLEIGQEIKVDAFKAGDAVDVQGTSIGKGFAGGMKRWHWRGGPGSHGSMFHRRIGSVGASSFPSRTWPGHKMPGHLGNVKKTLQNLEVLKIDAEKNLMIVKGSVPGGDNGLVFIRTALKLPTGIKMKVAPKKSEKKDPLKASKQAAAGGGKKK
jgi:large subunit ribosomal protein L3